MVEHVVESSAEIVLDASQKELVRVLHVDDDHFLLNVAKQCLEIQGRFQVDMASSVEEALEKMKNGKYDAVVSDYQMPGKDGLEFLKELRLSGSNVPFLIFTGKGREEVAIKALNLGADQYLNKIGDPETVYCELSHAIQRTVERRKAETALEILGERYKRLFESAVEGVVVNGSDGRVLSLNQAAANILGYDEREELIGRLAVELYADPTDRTRLLEELIEKGHVKDYELTWKKKDGTPIEILASVTIQKDEKGNLLRTEGIIRDVTEKKKVEKALKRSEEKYRILVEQSLQGIMICKAPIFPGLPPRIIFANQGMSKILGYTPEELTSLSPQETAGLVHPEDRQLFFGRFKDRLEGKSPPSNYEVRGIRKDGTVVWVEISSSRIEYDEYPAIQATFVDVTERKKAHDDRSKLLHDLGERAKELRCLYGMSKIVEKSDSLDELMHETVDLLPEAWQYSSTACARIAIGNREFKTANFRESKWRQRANIKIGREQAGFVEVLYLEERPTAAEGPFLKEERDLLNAVAERLGRVSERVKAEKMLKESHDRFEGLFRGNPEAAVYLEPDFRIEDINPRFKELFGYSLEEVKGKHINEVVVPNSRIEEARTLDDQAVEGYVSHNTLRRRKDGSLVPVSISAAPVTFKGQLLGYVGMYRDISDLKKAQEEVEESRRHFQSLFNLMADPVAIVDSKAMILDTTSRVQEITGYDKEELVGKNFLKLKMFSARTKAVMIKSLAKRMMGIHVSPYEVEIVTKGGAKIPYEINAAKIDYKGRPADLVVFHDVSERKKMEEKLRIVGSLTRHDVRNKLAAITGNIYLTKKKLAGIPDILENLNDMQLACDQIVRILEFARDYERLGMEELAFVDIGAMVDKATSSFSNLRGASVVNECHGLAALADSLLERLFYNLIDNSLKHGGKLTQIRIRHEESEDGLSIIYEDDGLGISKDARSRIFTEGFTTGKGSGYGLYLIRRMMEVYGWTIQETGEPSEGARFVMTIPKTKLNGKENYKKT